MRALWGFIRAVANHWQWLMSGLFGIALSALNDVHFVARHGFEGATVICFFVAGYRAWRDEHRARLASEAQLTEQRAAADMRPRLCGRCQRDVPRWFIDPAPLPATPFHERVSTLIRERHLSLSQAQLEASMTKADPYETYGCLVCSGKVHVYPDQGETRAEFDERVAQTTPRRLRLGQIDHFVQALTGSRGKIMIYHDPGSSDAEQFAGDFRHAFFRAGWDVSEGTLTSLRVPAHSGLALEWPHEDMDQPEPRMVAGLIRDLLAKAMSSADVKADVRERTEMWSKAHACLIVSRRPSLFAARSAGTPQPEGKPQ